MQPKNSIRRKPAFPDGMLIVLGVIILCVIVTWFIPSGQYDRILDASGRQIVDPNSFHYIESEKISLLRIPHFIVEGTIAQAEMIFFLLTIGGCYEIVMHTGVLQAIIARMAKWKVRDMAFILVFTLVFAVIAAPAGGVVAFIGFAPIFVMIARAMGYDALVGVSLVLLGGAVGAAAGPITPFTTGVAQGIAELPLYSGLSYRIICMLVLWIVTALFIARYAKKVRLDPSKSYVYDLEQVQKNQEVEKHYDTDLSAQQIAILVIFILGLCLIIYGSLRLNWGNRVHMQIYLCMSVILAIVGKFNPNETVRVFVRGAKGMLAAALVLGLSRSISMILDEALVLDTVIYGCDFERASHVAAGAGYADCQYGCQCFHYFWKRAGCRSYAGVHPCCGFGGADSSNRCAGLQFRRWLFQLDPSAFCSADGIYWCYQHLLRKMV